MGSVETGLVLASLAAVMTNLASLCKHHGCQQVAPVELHAPLRSARRLAASPWFAAGWGIAAAAWMIHVAALSLAPISLVQAVLAGGAVSLAVVSQGLFGKVVEPRQWLALLLGGSGLAVLALTLPGIDGSHSHFTPSAIIGFEAALGLLALALALGCRRQLFPTWHGALLAVIAGTLFAFAGVAIKALTGEVGLSPAILAPSVALIVLCGALAQYSTVAALQRGGAIETIGLMGLVASAAQIVSGVVVFGDPMASGTVGIGLQATAFGLICVSALLLPPSRRDPARLGQPLVDQPA